jgi:DeoR family glycerol-3-phosphate regulon repressor
MTELSNRPPGAEPSRPGQRRERILEHLRAGGRVGVAFLAERLGASRETIRRDLGALAADGLVRKLHGGAVLPEPKGEDAFAARLRQHAAGKRAVARRAARLFAPGDTLFLDTGTTTLALAEELGRRSGLTVITNGLALARAIGRGAGNRVFLLGGAYREEAAECLGGLVLEQLARFRAAHAVITVAGIGPEAVTDHDPGEAEVARAMVARAEAVTVVADGSKLGRTAPFEVCPLGRVGRLVVDKAPEGGLADALGAAGTEVILAPLLP